MWSLFIDSQEYLLFKSNFSFYEEGILEEDDLEKPAIVVQGISQVCPSVWKRAVAINMLKIVFAGAADHRQYPNPEEDRRIESIEDEEFTTLRTFARVEGYSLENPRLFFIQHVYPTLIKNFMLKETL